MKDTYSLRPLVDIDGTRHYEFVRDMDDFVIRSSDDYNYLLSFAEGYTSALNKSFFLE